ncbi:Alpha/Beta hydrolase protein [Entophlyctis helioformis]|nr:Alpha/Beta hydrolase protein [Entophlyctis helioformis]
MRCASGLNFARGFPFQPHYVTTKDGYILALHRIPCSRLENGGLSNAMPPSPGSDTGNNNTNNNNFSSTGSTISNGSSSGSSLRERRSHASFLKSLPPVTSTHKPVVLLWHGFLMCSEVWVCTPDPAGSLAFTLADAGYDVWMGNTRGNKYSCKHKKLKPSDEAFWNFSIDQLALCDLPDAVEYILKVTGAPTLSYIGFSQGTAQGFSALSLSPKLNKMINLFIALAPATKPRGFDNQTISSLVHASPEVIYLIFGRKALLSSVFFWQSILTPMTFAWIIDVSCWFLFGWDAAFMDYKHIIYRHLYSYSSVKIVVHWFQIMKSAKFQMYDDNPPVLPTAQEGYHVPRFPTTHIQTPIAIFYGGKDTLPDMDYIIRKSPKPTLLLKIEEYEHIQFLWGRGIDKVVYPAVLGLLAEHAEVWADASPVENDDERHNTRSVPWISQAEIDRLMYLGRVESYDNTGAIVTLGSSISVGEVLESRMQAIKEAKGQLQQQQQQQQAFRDQGGIADIKLNGKILNISTNEPMTQHAAATNLRKVHTRTSRVSFKEIQSSGPAIRRPTAQSPLVSHVMSDDEHTFEDCSEDFSS